MGKRIMLAHSPLESFFFSFFFSPSLFVGCRVVLTASGNTFLISMYSFSRCTSLPPSHARADSVHTRIHCGASLIIMVLHVSFRDEYICTYISSLRTHTDWYSPQVPYLLFSYQPEFAMSLLFVGCVVFFVFPFHVARGYAPFQGFSLPTPVRRYVLYYNTYQYLPSNSPFQLPTHPSPPPWGNP